RRPSPVPRACGGCRAKIQPAGPPLIPAGTLQVHDTRVAGRDALERGRALASPSSAKHLREGARHRSGRTRNPNRSRDRKGAFAGHTLSQRSLTGCPLGPALPEVRCTPGFSRLARTSVNRLTFKSRTRSDPAAARTSRTLL